MPAKLFLIEQVNVACTKFGIVNADESIVHGFRAIIDQVVGSDSISERQVNIMSKEVRELEIIQETKSMTRLFLDFAFSINFHTGIDVLSLVPPNTVRNQDLFHRIGRVAMSASHPVNLFRCLIDLPEAELEISAILAEKYYMEYLEVQSENTDLAVQPASIQHLIFFLRLSSYI
jgi:hypothetical protein